MEKPDQSAPQQPARKRTRFSLENLSDAFARLTGTQSTQDETSSTADVVEARGEPSDQPESLGGAAVSPRLIVEAMLFVGAEDGRPISPREIASHIRDVTPSEVESIVGELNESYAHVGAPYVLESECEGYRFKLREEFAAVRQRFHSRTREAKLTPPAIEVLSVVAYRQPIEADEVTRLRGHRSRAILNQLVRRGLLRLERPDQSPRKSVYHTTERFNVLFRIGSPQDLPCSADLEDC